jgi:hypothetical protein
MSERGGDGGDGGKVVMVVVVVNEVTVDRDIAHTGSKRAIGQHLVDALLRHQMLDIVMSDDATLLPDLE